MAKNVKPTAKGAGGAGKANRPVSAPAQKSSGSNPSGASTPGLEVISNRDGYRRGGRGWTKKPTIVAVADFTEEQLGLILADKDLTVTEVEIAVKVAPEPAPAADADPAQGAAPAEGQAKDGE